MAVQSTKLISEMGQETAKVAIISAYIVIYSFYGAKMYDMTLNDL